jgi:deoxyribodipyrimidine photo-lyase
MKALFWFRRDLRLEDNHGLFRALKENDQVISLFIFDQHILSRLQDRDDARVTFIYQEILRLKNELENLGSSLLVKCGDPLEILEETIREHHVSRVYVNHDYEPYARERDRKVADYLHSRNIDFFTFKDQVIFEKEEIIKDDGRPYTVFTPYMKRWRSAFDADSLPDYNTSPYLGNLFKTSPHVLPSLKEIGFTRSSLEFPPRKIDPQTLLNYD